MNYNSLGMFLEKNVDWILPKRGDMSPKTFLGPGQTHTIESSNWIAYCGGKQSLFEGMLSNLCECEEFWGEGYSVKVLFTLNHMSVPDKLCIWVVPVKKEKSAYPN